MPRANGHLDRRLELRIPAAMHTALHALSAERGVTVSALIREAVTGYFSLPERGN